MYLCVVCALLCVCVHCVFVVCLFACVHPHPLWCFAILAFVVVFFVCFVAVALLFLLPPLLLRPTVGAVVVAADPVATALGLFVDFRQFYFLFSSLCQACLPPLLNSASCLATSPSHRQNAAKRAH